MCIAIQYNTYSVFIYPRHFNLFPEYGTQIAIALFLVIPQLIAQFATTGAFEIVVDGEKIIWSKLQEGRFPNADELTNPLVKLGLHKSA